MRLLITRAEPAASDFARALAALGHAAVIAPLFRIVQLPAELPETAGFAAVIVSSANGVAALACRTDRRDITLIAVGPQTAYAARTAGFFKVLTGGGTSLALTEDLPRLIPADRPLLHITSPEGKRLLCPGYAIARADLYTAEAVPGLPENAIRALQNGGIDGAMFFSPRGAKIFRELIISAGLGAACAARTAYCISKNTQAALSPLDWADIRIAEKPDRAGMLALIQS